MISTSRSTAARHVARTSGRLPKSNRVAVGRYSRVRPAALGGVGVKQLLRPLYYSTERVIELRSGKDAKQVKSLYDATRETENCGVGLIASLKSTPSRHVVDVADEMLVRMSHRGGCGCDPNSGDGAGKRN